MTEASTTAPDHLRHFLNSPAGGASILLLASLAGFILANSPWALSYTALITAPLKLTCLGARGPENIDAWVSDGLMTLFFLVVILEIKKDIVSGHLSSLRRIALPLIGALGGMIVPALTYLLVTSGHPQAARGWAVPVATDAAFTLPLILALGRHVSPGARAWLMALAIFDDVLGIMLGLVIGKPVGVFGATLLSTRLKIATLPAETPTGMLFGLSLLCGIGFTISLFVANLAFSGSDLAVPAKMGIFAGSILSALLGWLWLRFSHKYA